MTSLPSEISESDTMIDIDSPDILKVEVVNMIISPS